MAHCVSNSPSLGEDDETAKSDLEVATVLSKGVKPENGQIVSPNKRYTPISYSHYSPFRPTTVMTNISRGNIKTETPVPEIVSLHQMASQGELILLQEDIKGQDFNYLNQVDENGLTPIMWAAAYNQILTVECLLEHGADVNMVGPGNTNALLLASSQGHDRLVNKLLQSGMNINHTCSRGNSALMYAAHGNHVDCVKLLLDWGVDLTLKNTSNQSVMDVAVTLGHREVQRALEHHLIKLLDPQTSDSTS